MTHVVQVVGGVLRHAQGPAVREEEVHLRRRLRVRRELEHHPNAVYLELLAGVGDVDGRWDERKRPGRGRLAQAHADLSGRALWEQRAEHVRGAAGHCAARIHVLAHRMLQEPLRREHRHPSGCDVFVGEHTARAAEVIDVAVGVEQPGHRAVAAMLAVEGQRRRGALRGYERVDHQHAGVALDNRHVREVQPADLVDAVGHLEETVNRRELSLPPETRVHGVRTLSVEEVVGVRVPDDAPAGRPDHRVRQRRHPPSARVLEVRAVAEGKAQPCRGVGLGDLGCGLS